MSPLWLFFLLAVATIFPVSSSNSPTKPSYTDHCNSVVPADSPTEPFDGFHSLYLLAIAVGHFSGGTKLLPHDPQTSSFSFSPHHTSRTETPNLFKLDGMLTFHNTPTNPRTTRYPVMNAMFELSGFWSESTGSLCMVGSGFRSYREGWSPTLSAVFKLHIPTKSNIKTSFAVGSVESLDSPDSPNHFDPISMFVYIQMDYEYTLIPHVMNTCSGLGVQNDSLSSGFEYFCGSVRYNSRSYRLVDGASLMILGGIHCSKDGRFRTHISFRNRSNSGDPDPLVPSKTLVGEGFWDRDRNRLCFVGCRVLSLGDSLEEAIVGECEVGFGMWLPKVLSLRNRSSPVGKIWSINQTDPVMFWSTSKNIPSCSDYNYTMTNVATELYLKKDEAYRLTNRRFPDGDQSLSGMRFDIRLRNSGGRSSWGHSFPLFVGEKIHCDSPAVSKPTTVARIWTRSDTLLNVSYTMKYELNYGLSGELMNKEDIVYKADGIPKEEEISAEGVYHADSGVLYMVGCRLVGFPSIFDEEAKGEETTDCDILMEVRVPALDSEGSEHFNGSIWSTREKLDPLYFAPIEISSHAVTIESEGYGSYGGIGFVPPGSGSQVGLLAEMDDETFMVLLCFIVCYIFIGLLFLLLKRPNWMRF